MFSNQKTVGCVMVTIAALILLPAPVQAQTAKAEHDLIAAARQVMITARYCTLITITSGGKAEARTMDPLAPDENLIVWFATNPLSRKVKEIRRHPHVTIHYFDAASQAYVALQGTARIVTDPAEKRRRWKEEWKPFYPDREKSFLLIAVTPQRIEVVDIAKGIVGDPKTWKPNSVTFSRRRRP